MKLAALATLIAASFALVAADAPCDAKLTTALTAAASLQAKCKSDSGFDITAASVASADVLAKFCKSESCLTMWKAVKDLGLAECMIYDKHLNKEILNPAEAACKGTATAAADSDDDSHDSHDMAAMNSTTTMTTKAPTSNSTTPASTTKASNSTSSGNSTATTKVPTASNSTSSNSTKTPAPTTKAPTPSTSGASALSLTASAVVITVAATFF